MTPAVPQLAEGAPGVVAPLVGAVAGALWPPLAAPLLAVAMAWALAASGDAMTTLLGGLLLVVVLPWWAVVGRRERLSSLAILLPCCLPSPVCGAALSGYALDPAPAAGTAALGYLVGTLYHAAGRDLLCPRRARGEPRGAGGRPRRLVAPRGLRGVRCAQLSRGPARSVASGVSGQVLGLGPIALAALAPPGWRIAVYGPPSICPPLSLRYS